MKAADAGRPAKGGGAVIQHLTRCLRLATSYDLANVALSAPIEDLVVAVNGCSRDGGTVAVQVVRDKFFLNKKFVRLEAAAFDQARPLLQIFDRLKINEIAFHVVRLEGAQVRKFLEIYKRYFVGSEPGGIVHESFDEVAVRSIDGTEADAFDVGLSPQHNLVRQYCLLVVYLERVSNALRQGTPTRLAGLRRMLQALSDASDGFESLLVGVTALEQFAGHQPSHQTRCAAFALLMGRALGLPRTTVIDVALAALFHDLGRDEAAAAGEAPAEPSDAVRRIALRSMLRMCRSGVGLDTHLRLAVAREVWAPLRSEPSLPARLVAVVCAFDLLTRPGPGRCGLAPDHAISLLLNQSRSRYDRRILRLLADAIGVFPAGTAVELTSGQVGVTIRRPAAEPAGVLPMVQVAGHEGAIDLARPDARVTLRRCIDAREHGINVVHALMG